MVGRRSPTHCAGALDLVPPWPAQTAALRIEVGRCRLGSFCSATPPGRVQRACHQLQLVVPDSSEVSFSAGFSRLRLASAKMPEGDVKPAKAGAEEGVLSFAYHQLKLVAKPASATSPVASPLEQGPSCRNKTSPTRPEMSSAEFGPDDFADADWALRYLVVFDSMVARGRGCRNGPCSL